MTLIDRQEGLAAIHSRSFARDASRLNRLAVEIRSAQNERRVSPLVIEVRSQGRVRPRQLRGIGAAAIHTAGTTTEVLEEER